MRTTRWSKGLAATVAAMAVSALCAGSAFAAPAVFNDAHTPPPPYPNDSDPIAWGIEGTLKVSVGDPMLNNTEARCTSAHLTQPMAGSTTSNSGSPLQGRTTLTAVQAFCPMGTGNWGMVYFAIPGNLVAESNGGAYTLTASNPAVVTVISNSFLGPMWRSDVTSVGSYSGVWTNGTSVANPSRLTFTATTVAKHYGSTHPVKVTGTFTARNPHNPNAQLVTLN